MLTKCGLGRSRLLVRIHDRAVRTDNRAIAHFYWLLPSRCSSGPAGHRRLRVRDLPALPGFGRLRCYQVELVAFRVGEGGPPYLRLLEVAKDPGAEADETLALRLEAVGAQVQVEPVLGPLASCAGRAAVERDSLRMASDPSDLCACGMVLRIAEPELNPYLSDLRYLERSNSALYTYPQASP